MSIRLMNEIWWSPLPLTDKMILLALADCANDDGECWPSITHLQKKCSAGRTTIFDILKRLETSGYIVRYKDEGRKNYYKIYSEPTSQTLKSHPTVRRTRSGAAPVRQADSTRPGAVPQPVRQPNPTRPAPGLSHIEEPSYNHQVNHQEPPKASKAKKSVKSPKTKPSQSENLPDEPDVAIPDWLPAKDWEDFVNHRIKIGKEMTPIAKTRGIKKLSRLRNQGYDPVKLIDKAIFNKWQDFFPDNDCLATPPNSPHPPLKSWKHQQIVTNLQAGDAWVAQDEHMTFDHPPVERIDEPT